MLLQQNPSKIIFAIRNNGHQRPLLALIGTPCIGHWKGITKTNKRYQIHVRLAKYWSPKQRSEAGHARQEKRQEETVNTCPLQQCGCIEVAQHFLYCPVLHNAHIAEVSLQSLYKWFSKTRTHHHIKNLIIIAIKAWITKQDVPWVWDILSELQDWGLDQAITDQNKIGWSNFSKAELPKRLELHKWKHNAMILMTFLHIILPHGGQQDSLNKWYTLAWTCGNIETHICMKQKRHVKLYETVQMPLKKQHIGTKIVINSQVQTKSTSNELS